MDINRRHILLIVLLHQIMCRSFLVLCLLTQHRRRLLGKRHREPHHPRASYSMTQRIPARINHLSRIIEMGDVQCVVNLRMNRNAFARLCYLLTHVGGLAESRFVRVEEKVVVFLSILAHHKKNRVIGHDYIHSGHTISMHFHDVLRSILKLYPLLLAKPIPVDDSCTIEPWKWFKQYDSCSLLAMESGATSGSFDGKGKKVDKTRRSWTEREEEVLLQALKEAIAHGWKSENGFRAGYLGFLEHRMKKTFPETNIRGNPHINSKVHVWKKMYGTLVTILSKSGVGWNDTEKTIEATNEAWEAIVKADHNTRLIRRKRWTYYDDWCEIFGNDRATGEKAENFTTAVQDVNLNAEVPNDIGVRIEDLLHDDEGASESMSVSLTPASKATGNTKSKGKKRKQVDDNDDAIVTAINNFADATTKTMTELIKRLASDEKMTIGLDNVLDAMRTLPELTEEEQFIVAEMLVDNQNKLSLFLCLSHAGRLSMARRLLRGC